MNPKAISDDYLCVNRNLIQENLVAICRCVVATTSILSIDYSFRVCRFNLNEERVELYTKIYTFSISEFGMACIR